MEAGLKKLEAQEQKCSAELDKVLIEYADLKGQAVDFDPVELYAARQVIRPTQEKTAERQLEDSMQSLICCSMSSRKRLDCSERMQKSGRCGR